jgi:putative transposase
MSYLRIWIHYAWSTKDRFPLLTKETREQLIKHMKLNAKEKDIWVDTCNGYTDHWHCLVSLSKEQSIAKVAQLLKGESAHWINKNSLSKGKFMWQDDYFAVSVGHSQVDAVRKYIRNQEAHHKKKTFAQEVDEFMKKYGWEYLG